MSGKNKILKVTDIVMRCEQAARKAGVYKETVTLKDGRQMGFDEYVVLLLGSLPVKG